MEISSMIRRRLDKLNCASSGSDTPREGGYVFLAVVSVHVPPVPGLDFTRNELQEVEQGNTCSLSSSGVLRPPLLILHSNRLRLIQDTPSHVDIYSIWNFSVLSTYPKSCMPDSAPI